ncbi:MAG: hypothetical protein LBB08_00810 [Rickettsiales bacterium]|jgi:hypothetical protein|nr:hypothetical protein [Rickettsiales bacterium]
MIGAAEFFSLEKKLIESGMDADLDSFAVIKERLAVKQPLTDDEFARNAIYVVLAGGFSQKTAKRIHTEIMGELAGGRDGFDHLFSIFHNKNKINAAIKLWRSRNKLRDDYYKLPDDLSVKLGFLSKLPHIGKITANHLARNLGEDIVKYDIWIQRLATRGTQLERLVDNGSLNPEVKSLCDDMFAELTASTGLPRGYIDVVLWKSCQEGLIQL